MHTIADLQAALPHIPARARGSHCVTEIAPMRPVQCKNH